MRLQRLIRAIYPAQCVACDAPTETEFGLCGTCWAETQFIGSVICDTCGAPLPGEPTSEALQCDDCLTIARPWAQGRAVFAYAGTGRRLILGLKHGDRTDVVPAMTRWMQPKLDDMALQDPLIVPVPLHWTRLARRRYNQSALLARALGRQTGWAVCVDALHRPQRTVPLDGHTRDARFAQMAGAITCAQKRCDHLVGRHVLLIDDVMTSGATLAASAEAAKTGGAKDVSVVTLARVVKDA